MSNWDGVGTPANGQFFLNTQKGNEYSFVGLSNNFNWVGQDSFGTLTLSIPSNCKPIKTPEQVEEEKAIDDIDLVLGMAHMVNKSQATALHESGYHNQPKVRSITFKEYYKAIDDADTYFDSWKLLIARDHIIEAKEKDNE